MMQMSKKWKENFALDNNKSGVGKLISACTAWTDFCVFPAKVLPEVAIRPST